MPLETKSVWWGLYKSLDSKKPFLPWVKLCRLLLCQDGLCWACQVLSVINSPVDQRLVVVCLKDPRCHYFCFILILPLFIDYHSVTKFQNLVLFPLRRRGIILVRFCRIDVHLVDGSHRWGMRMLSDFRTSFCPSMFCFQVLVMLKAKKPIHKVPFLVCATGSMRRNSRQYQGTNLEHANLQPMSYRQQCPAKLASSTGVVGHFARA